MQLDKASQPAWTKEKRGQSGTELPARPHLCTRRPLPPRRHPSCSPQEWGLPPSSLLMVGDSFEDVECGNASGTATCLVAGERGGECKRAVGPPRPRRNNAALRN